MNIPIDVLLSYVIMGVLLTLATENIVSIATPYKDIKKYALSVAFGLAVLTIFAYNQGILETLQVSIDASKTWFHWVDLGLTSLLLAIGAQGVHKLVEGVKQYLTKTE